MKIANVFENIKNVLVGKPLKLNSSVREHIALVSIMAWIGLGADGLSSSAYGPSEAYLALGQHTSIAIYLAVATTVTVFLIAFAYSQVIELFPTGGGGYKVATHLISPAAGAVSGAALIIDYILTIAVSVASGVDAVFSFLPTSILHFKIEAELGIIIVLMILNLRGMKESIKVLMPLFFGFLITHIAIILAGILFHKDGLSQIIPQSIAESHRMSSSIGILATVAIFLRAYSMGGGTYTGLEAVSTNTGMLAEPKIRTGKNTMMYMAVSLSFMAGGIILLYLLWHVHPVYGQTLNAVVFGKILDAFGFGNGWLVTVLFFEAMLLFVGANTGFLGCPAVMANMASGKWLPSQFGELSGRLVSKNGVIISGVAAMLILLWARGSVSTLVVLYSINVFLTFSLSLYGLCAYWIRSRKTKPEWIRKLPIAIISFVVCASILVITTFEKFAEGGWLTVLITCGAIAFCFVVRGHYRQMGFKLRQADRLFAPHFASKEIHPENFISIEDTTQRTAVFFVTKHYGAGLHTLLWVQRLFPDVFKNFIFVTSGEIDFDVFANNEVFKTTYRKDLDKTISRYQQFCTDHQLPSAGYFSYGVDRVDELIKLSEQIKADYPDCVFFGSKMVFVDESWWNKYLHNNTVNILQRELHLLGLQMVIMPMRID